MSSASTPRKTVTEHSNVGSDEAVVYDNFYEPMRSMTEAEIVAAAGDDPDNPLLIGARLATLKLVPKVRTLRRALGLTQEGFASRFQIPIGTLRDWEQGRSVPDQPARAYLAVIAFAPDTVFEALNR